MISIIVPVRNQYAMNCLFIESLRKYSYHPFELIVIDNASTDNSAELYESFGAKVIRNKDNYSYPHCMNQGFREAGYDVLAFFNNDIIVSKDWDKILIETLRNENLDVAGFGSNSPMEKHPDTRALKRRWKQIKNLLLYTSGFRKSSLHLMLWLTYGNWERWTKRWRAKYSGVLREGFTGSCVIMTRRGYELLGGWDERLQAADYDMYMKTKSRYLTHADIKPPVNIMEIFIHHYGRLTLKKDYIPFKDKANIISIEEKWSENERQSLLKDLNHEKGRRL
ncbi:MAG: glycosyltransferase [Tannerellaceae bacterium]|jgi:glycosyltransferase involved in cell wall biosynthesis|nr:glycosyltransferase [Tannerellaceae bacterium]